MEANFKVGTFHSSKSFNVGWLTLFVMKTLQQADTFKVLQQDSYQDWS